MVLYITRRMEVSYQPLCLLNLLASPITAAHWMCKSRAVMVSFVSVEALGRLRDPPNI